MYKDLNSKSSISNFICDDDLLLWSFYAHCVAFIYYFFIFSYSVFFSWILAEIQRRMFWGRFLVWAPRIFHAWQDSGNKDVFTPVCYVCIHIRVDRILTFHVRISKKSFIILEYYCNRKVKKLGIWSVIYRQKVQCETLWFFQWSTLNYI